MVAGYNPVEGFVQSVDFSMEAGERVALLGGERSGSSLLLKVLCGLRARRSGLLNVLGEEIAQLQFYDDWDHIFSRETRIRIGVALEREGLLANVTLNEGFKTVQTFGDRPHLSSVNDQKRIDQVLNWFDLQNVSHLRPHHLSSAERRFASLARAALLDPEVFAFEGPTKNLDDGDRQKLFSACDEMFFDKRKSLLAVTEDWSFAMRYCTRVIVMEDGKKMFDGSWQDLPHGMPSYWQKVSASLKRRWELDAPLREVV